MENINLCGRAKCCPSIKEDWERHIMYIVDGNNKIAFNEEQIQKLTEYLCKRKGSVCKCASCLGQLDERKN